MNKIKVFMTKLYSFYNQIKLKKKKYFFGSKDIYIELSKNYKKYFDKNIDILDLGCGDLQNFYLLKKFKFKSYTGVDWIKHFTGIKDKRFFFVKEDILNFLKNNKTKYNLIISIGTLEHFLKPWIIISKFKKSFKKNGKLIFAYPNYYNPRGLVLLALMLLVNKKITLYDKYFFAPDELKKNLNKLGYKKISIKSIREEGGYKKLAKDDLTQRLPKIFKKKLNLNMLKFLSFFETYSKYYKPNKFSGQILIVKAEF